MSEEALRDNADKPDLSLIPLAFEAAVAQVMMHGARKYKRDNYWKGHRITSLIASMKRHIGKILKGEDIDEESGCSHWAHVAAGCLMALHQQELGTLKDDRTRLENVLGTATNNTPQLDLALAPQEPATTWDVVVSGRGTYTEYARIPYLTKEEADKSLGFHAETWPRSAYRLVIEERPNDRLKKPS